MGFLVTFGLTHPMRADDPPAASTNAAPGTVPDATQTIKPPPAPVSSNSSIDEMSIDQLLNVTVTSAGQKEQKLSDVAAAITVLNADDIRRSGATTIPDLLRYVPGVEVGQGNNGDVSVGVRGFGGIFSTKLLVLVDGRSIYDPVYGGVDWADQRMMMDDIDRVEVIRGPGATIWGANAVNGVINIITKDAADTQGGFISGVYGTREEGMGEFRYGFQPLAGLSLRLYGQYENVAASDSLPGVQRFDQLQNGLIGFRADYRPDADNHFRLSSEASTSRSGDEQFGFTATPPYTNTGDGQNVNFVYEHNFDVDNQLTVQSYYDRFARGTEPTGQFGDVILQTADLQIRHTLPVHLLPIKQELTYGVEYRQVDSQLANTHTISWLRGRDDQTFSLFAQTDLHLVEDVLTLTAGTKYDHNDYTGNEVQPSIRLLWKIDPRNSLWWSVSRAVREPSLSDYEATAPGQLVGNSNMKSEELIATEMGYRVEPTTWLSFDISTFYNSYHDLMELYLSAGSFQPTYEQFQKAQTYGIEPSFTAQVQPWWKLTGSYSLLNFHTDNSGIPSGETVLSTPIDQVDATNQFALRSSFNLPQNVDIDLGGRYVDKIAGANGYFAVDVRVGWRPSPNWEISVVGQNLLSGNHIENPNTFGNSTYVSPQVYGKIVFKF
jgi:iron complex outermembrane receptor protein